MCKLRCLSLAEHDRTETPNLLHNGGISSAAPSFVDRRTEFSDEVRRFDDVLDSEGNFREWAIAGLRLGIHLNPGVDGSIQIAHSTQKPCASAFTRGRIRRKPLFERPWLVVSGIQRAPEACG